MNATGGAKARVQLCSAPTNVLTQYENADGERVALVGCKCRAKKHSKGSNSSCASVYWPQIDAFMLALAKHRPAVGARVVHNPADGVSFALVRNDGLACLGPAGAHPSSHNTTASTVAPPLQHALMCCSRTCAVLRGLQITQRAKDQTGVAARKRSWTPSSWPPPDRSGRGRAHRAGWAT